MPDQLAAFYNDFRNDAFQRVQGKRQLRKHDSNPDAATETIMWSGNPSNPADPTKLAMLTWDIFPDGTDKEGKRRFAFQPRRWLLGSNVQAVILYEMSCCAGLSAIGTFKQNGKILPALFENQKFVTPDYRDLFKLSAPAGTKSGLEIDHDGGILSHWYDHITDRPHDCQTRHALSMPGRLNIRFS